MINYRISIGASPIVEDIKMGNEYLISLEEKLNEYEYDQIYIDACCKYASRLIENKLPVIFDVNHFCLLIGAEKEYITKLMFSEDRFYKVAQIPKKRNGLRELSIPCRELKYIQRWILDNILINIQVSDYAMGFKNDTSIMDNAKKHLNKECVINLDIKDFFPTITFERVFRIFSYYGYTKEVSFFLAKLCTYKDQLPQGSPASPCLSNIVCLKLDARLSSLAIKYEADYTRYADDITFSGKCGMNKIIEIASVILKEEGFYINDCKTRIAYKHQRQEVTGLIVNNSKVKVNRFYKRDLWQQIYYCKKYGIKNHLEKIECNKSFFKEHMYGRAYFVNMIEPDEGFKMLAELDKIKWDY